VPQLLTTLVLGGSSLLARPAASEAKGKKRRKKRRRSGGSLPPVSPPPPPCQGATDDTPCDGSDRCLLGRCNPRPTCGGTGASCSGVGTPGGCCSSSGCTVGEQCLWGEVGDPCYRISDCAPGLWCVGYVCMSTTCGPRADHCTSGNSRCGEGFCLRPVDGGASRCGTQPPPFDRCGCTSHADCADLGAGAFCARDTGDHCGSASCPAGATTFCAVPR
jgi:hypothetical protein